MDIRLKKATVVIFLDRSAGLCIFRTIKRFIKNYGSTRDDMTTGCKERITFDFLKYIANYNRSRRPGILKKLEKLEKGKAIYRLSSNREVKRFLEEMKTHRKK